MYQPGLIKHDGWQRASPKYVGEDARDDGMAAEQTRGTAHIAYIYAPIRDCFEKKTWRKWFDIALYLSELLYLDNCYVCHNFIAWCVLPYLPGTYVIIKP